MSVPTRSLILAAEPSAVADVYADMNVGQIAFLGWVQAVEELLECSRVLERENVGSP